MTPYERAMERFSGKKVLIFGLGLLGGAIGDTRFFCSLGAQVRVTDKKTPTELSPSLDQLQDLPLELSLGTEDPKDIDWADIILRNPSVPLHHPLLEAARAQGKPIEMRTSLFLELAATKTIGITGTRGKTTTTAMIYELAKKLSSDQVFLGGNIAGVSDLALLPDITDSAATLVILELSSWQLQGFKDNHVSPQIAVVTNLYPDHLNVYPDLAAYYADKKNIFLYQTAHDHVVLNARQAEFQQWAEEAPGEVHWFSDDQLPPELKLQIPGQHNRANAAAALEVARLNHWSESQSIELLNSFTGVPYRLQTIATKKGITYINDTAATTPVATITALKSLAQPLILICGGNDKNLPIDELVQQLNTSVKTIVLLPGTGTDRLKPLLRPEIPLQEAGSMHAAVALAAAAAQEGDIVVLSPGFTSFGLFHNEFDRGDQFNQCVRDLG